MQASDQASVHGGAGGTAVVSREYRREMIAQDLERDTDYAASRILLKVSRLRPPRAGEAILDIGCGTGGITGAYAKAGLRATGVEFVPEFVEIARSASPHAAFVVGAAEALPFADGQFAFVTMNEVLEHVQDWRGALSEAVRVLEPGGVLLLSTNNRLCPTQHEIRYFVGFGYLPSVLQQRIFAWAMKHHPRLIGFTNLPARNWFIYGQIARELRRLGTAPHRWLTLLDVADFPARYQKYGSVLRVLLRTVPYSLLPNATTTVAFKLR